MKQTFRLAAFLAGLGTWCALPASPRASAQNAISTGTKAGFRMYYPGGNDWWLDPSQGRFDIRKNGGAPSATINGLGQLGIGTTSPAAPLYVVGSASLGISNQLYTIVSDPLGGIANGGLGIGYDSNNFQPFVQAFYNKNLELLPNGGNVGIGKTNPGYALDVQGAMAVSSALYPNGGFQGSGQTIPFNNAIWNFNGRLWQTAGCGSCSPIFFAPNGVYGAPAALELDPTFSAGWVNYYSGMRIVPTVGGASAFNQPDFQGLHIGSPGLTGGATISTNYGLYVDNQTAGTTNYGVYSNGGLNYFAGNVSIGTTTTALPLTVFKGTQSGITVQSGNSGATDTGVEFDTPDHLWKVGNNIGGVGVGKFNIYDLSGGGSRLVIDANGNVGIGVTSPAQALDVEGNIRMDNTGQLGWYNSSFTGGNNSYLAAWITKSNSTYSGDLQFWVRYGGNNQAADAMSITSPPPGGFGQVNVNGNLSVNAGLNINNGLVTMSGLVPSPLDTGYVSYFSTGKPSGAGTASTLQLYKIDTSVPPFAEGIVELTYGTRLQGISDTVAGAVKKLYAFNRFNSTQVTINQTTVFVEDSNSAAYAPVTLQVVGSGASAYLVVQVAFSSALGPSSYVWGEVKVFIVNGAVPITKLL